MREEPKASTAEDVAPSADVDVPASAAGVDESAGVELPGTGDSEDSDIFFIKRSRSSVIDDRGATSGAAPSTAPSTEPSPPVAARKRSRIGRLVRTHYARAG